MSRSAEFESAQVAARDLQPGDRLDISGKVRVHAVKPIGDKIGAAHKTRGSKSGGISMYSPDQQVRVWRKK